MKSVFEYFEEMIWKYQFDIKQEEIPHLISWEIQQEFPGNYEPKVSEIRDGCFRLDLIFKTDEDATLFYLKYKLR